MQVKGVYNYGKTRVVSAKYNWIGGNFKISVALLTCFSYFIPCKKNIIKKIKNIKICIYPKVSFEMYVLKSVKR
jgi:hypothetical protein